MRPAATSIAPTPAPESSVRVAAAAQGDVAAARDLARTLGLALTQPPYDAAGLVLEVTSGRLQLRDPRSPRTRPLSAELFPVRIRRQRLPLSKRGPLALAVGRRSRTVVDATAGWGADSGLLAAMGYRVVMVERSPLLAVLLSDAVRRVQREPGAAGGKLVIPELVQADAVGYLYRVTTRPDCVYMDPMFPPKRNSAALAKRPLRLLRELVGDDEDAGTLLAAARTAARSRVVVKRPDHAPPLAEDVDLSHAGKLVRYDVYLAPAR
jgi:16S rRNA (guanine1516-N2)-methyltransferase